MNEMAPNNGSYFSAVTQNNTTQVASPSTPPGGSRELGLSADSLSELSKVAGVAFLLILLGALACVLVFVAAGCQSVRRRRSIQQDKEHRRRSSNGARSNKPRRSIGSITRRRKTHKLREKPCRGDVPRVHNQMQMKRAVHQRVVHSWSRRNGRRRSRSNRSLVETISSVSTGTLAVPDENVFISSKL